jgi:hypothetical protein
VIYEVKGDFLYIVSILHAAAALGPLNLAAREVFLVGEADAVGVFIARHVGENDLIADL